MDSLKKCSKCGGKNLEMGKLPTYGKSNLYIIFDSVKKKFISLTSNAVEVRGVMCLDCGGVDLFGDLETAKKKLEKD
jgi:predicted nucleic-acid-binding Zn-ribbon protein